MRAPALVTVALGLAMGLPLALPAQEAGGQPQRVDLSSLSFEELLDCEIVTASRATQRVSQAPAKVIVVTAQQIRLRGYLDLEEVLHDLPGFDFNKGMGVDWSTIFMRGVRSDNSDRFLLIWDGVIQNDIWKQSSWISRQYPLSNVERIEVMYGPSSLLYGANAFSGIVNVILKQERDVDGLAVHSAAGSFDTRLVELNFGKQIGDWRFMFNGRWFTSDEMDFNRESWVDNAGRRRGYSTTFPEDYAPPSDPDYALDVEGDVLYWTVDGERVRFNPRMEQRTRDWFVQGGIGYRGFNLRALSWYREESEGPWYTPQRRINGVWIPTGMAVNGWYEQDLSPRLHSKSYVIYRESGIDSDSNDASFSAHFTGDVDDPLELRIYRLGPPLYHFLDNSEWRIGEQLNLELEQTAVVIGGEYTITRVSENYNTRFLNNDHWTMSPRHEERNLAFYANAQVEASEHFALAAGLRFDDNSLHGEEGGFESLYTGRLAALITPASAHSVKLIYAQSFQAPDSWHRFATDQDIRPVPAPDLEPERLATFEIVYGFQPKPHWESSLSLFHTQITDLIGTVEYEHEGATVTRFDNVGSVNVVGAEVESRYFFSQDRSCSGSLTLTRSEDADSGRETGDIAPFKANLGCDLLFRERWGVAGRLRYVFDRDTVGWDSDSIYGVRQVDDHLTVDLTLSRLDVLPGLDLRAVLNNLFDARYYDPGPRAADGISYNAAILQEPFHFTLGLAYRF